MVKVNKKIIKSDCVVGEEKTQKKLDAAIPTIMAERQSSLYGEAGAVYILGYQGNSEHLVKGLKDIAKSRVNPRYEYINLKQQAGFSAEQHFQDQYNARAILEGSKFRLTRTDHLGGNFRNHEQYDLIAVDVNGNPLVKDGNQFIYCAQMKFRGRYEDLESIKKSAENSMKKFVNDKEWYKYKDAGLLVPSEQYGHMKDFGKKKIIELTKQLDKCKKISEKAEQVFEIQEKIRRYEDVTNRITDSGISSQEAMLFRQHPGIMTVKHVAQNSLSAGLAQAQAAVIVAGSISVAQNIYSCINGEKDVLTAGKDVAFSTVCGTSKTVIITSVSTMTKTLMQSSTKLSPLAKTSLPTAIVNASFEIGKVLRLYCKGEITELQAISKMGEKGTSMMSASMGAAFGTLILPGIGTFVGSTIGCLVSSILYQESMNLLKEVETSAEERRRAESISEEATAFFDGMRADMERSLTDQIYRDNVFYESVLPILHYSNKIGDHQLFCKCLDRIAHKMGLDLPYSSENVFRKAMVCPDRFEI